MSQGIKNYAKIITNSVGNAQGHLNVNKNNNDLHISIPLLQTVGLSQISPTLVYCNSGKTDNGLFGRGIRLNYFKALSGYGSEEMLVSDFDYSNEVYLKQTDGTYVSSVTNSVIRKVYDDEYEISYHFELEDKSGNVMHFITETLQYPSLIVMKNGDRYSLDFISDIKTISNGKGDVVKFSGTSKINLVEYYHNNKLIYKTSITYSNLDYISKVVGYNAQNEVLFDMDFSILLNSATVIDNMTNYQIKYSMGLKETRFSQVIDGYGASFERGNTLNIEYGNNKTVLTNDLGDKHYIYFDESEFPILEVDNLGTAVEKMYDKYKKLLVYTSTPVYSKEKPQNLFYGENITAFTSTKDNNNQNTITKVTPSTLVAPFDSILGSTVRKCSGTGILSYEVTKEQLDLLDARIIANDTLTLSLWGKQLTPMTETSYVKVELKLISENEDDTINSVRIFDKTTIDEHFDLLTLGLCAEKSYEKAIINIYFYGDANIELGGVQLLKKTWGSFYEYDNSGNLLSYGVGGETNNLSYNESNVVTESLDSNSALQKYEYNDKNLLTKVITPYQTILENTYNNYNNIIKSSVYKNNQKIMETSQTFSNGRFLNTSTDEGGNTTTYTYNQDYGYLNSIRNALNITTEYDYYNDGLLMDIYHEQTDNVHYTYENEKIHTITLSNGTSYEFEYDQYENVTRILLNGETLYKFDYDNKNNIIKKFNGENSGYYQFVYQNYKLLTQVKYVSTTGVESLCFSYTYDGLERIKSITDKYGNVEEFSYDSDGRVLDFTTNNQNIKYTYDNSGNITGVCREVCDEKLHQSFGSVNRTCGSHPALLKECEFCDEQNIIVFIDDASTISGGDVKAINHNGNFVDILCEKSGNIPCTTVDTETLLSYKLNCNSPSTANSGTIAFWFKPYNNDFYLFSIKSSNTNYFLGVYINEEGKIVLEVTDSTGNNKKLLTSYETMKINEWNYFALTFRRGINETTNIEESRFIMSLNYVSYNHYVRRPCVDFNIDSSPVYNIGHKYDGTSCSNMMIGNIAGLLLVGNKIVEHETLVKYQRESKEYVIDSKSLYSDMFTSNYSHTTLFTESFNTGLMFDIVPLHNDFKSINGLLPIVSQKRVVSSLDRDRTFRLNTVNKRFAYVADGNKLVYDLGMYDNKGTVIMRAFTDEHFSTQYLFEMKDYSDRRLALYRNESNKLCVNLNGVYEETTLEFSNNVWHTVGITFGDFSRVDSLKQSVKVFLDGEEYLLTNLIQQPYSSMKIMIGRNYDSDYNINPLYGQIEMLVFRDNFCSLSQMSSLCEDLKGITKISAFDELGMVRKTEVHKAGTPIVSNTYSYKKTSSNLLTKNIETECIKLNDELLTNRRYYYDYLNRVIDISDELFGYKFYDYDNRGFVIEEEGIVYEYDANGNITKKNNINLTYDSIKKDRLLSYGDKLITYHSNSPWLVSTYDGYSYSYEGNRLTQISGNNKVISFKYNSQGLRKQKVVTQNGVTTTTDYYYAGNQLITQVCGYERVDFLYDEYGELFGFIVNNYDRYYYVRDALKNILGICSHDGELVVKYDCSAYGEIRSITGLLASTIGELNPFRYKGYYYDVETGLFMVGHRYYNPEWGRWLSPDDIEYLDPQSINGLNLYAYCGNDPVNKYDPTGHSSMPTWLKLTIGAVVLVGAVVAAVATGGAALAVGAAIGAGVGAGLGLAGGITLDENGALSYDLDKAASGFMFGSITGAISGIAGSYFDEAIKAGSMLAKGAMALIDGTLSLGSYIGQIAIDTHISDVTLGGALISFGSGLFSFADRFGGWLDDVWGPTMGAEIAWVYDLFTNKKRKRIA